MTDLHDLGKKGEDVAAEYLRKKGYRIIQRNWKSGRNEIDIIAENKDFIIFAEVKTRSGDFLIDPASAVTEEKQRILISVADNFIRRFKIAKEYRFDIISIVRKDQCLGTNNYSEEYKRYGTDNHSAEYNKSGKDSEYVKQGEFLIDHIEDAFYPTL